MTKKELLHFINKHKESDDFTGGVDEKQMNTIQSELGIILPESYKWFLTTYGSGGIFGVNILGVAKSNRAPVVVTTKKYRDLGMGKDLVVIEDAGEYAYCLYVSKMNDHECPVIAWNRPRGLDDYNTSENFYEFLYQRLVGAQEMWEEDI
ncbi:SMI1/KNR4 family protein [Rossellomorea marisflavi]|uniref:SMI1/KNR4 family protein n=1 Tax=Rossellomorea marisflavi TaxID=189381 RepID=UPI0011E8490A|nr:SMI1/KNR4 family protein [Rossellomorea marisflavi]MCM2590912.1 SMI1/KNR4 family protein [Rossellomorea marisflavi]TYO74381.1 SMI1/KNR4 family protein [Rossellomorea marisflavi]